MKKKLFNLFILSSILTVIGFLVDGDPKEPSMLMRFIEFFAMIGILFLLSASIYFTTTFAYKKLFRRLSS